MDDDIEAQLNLIGELLAADESFPIDRTLLLAHVSDSHASVWIIRDLGDSIITPPCPMVVIHALMDLWKMAPADSKWTTVRYFIRNGQFEGSFTYETETDDLLSHDEFRRIAREVYGDKSFASYSDLYGEDPPPYEEM